MSRVVVIMNLLLINLHTAYSLEQPAPLAGRVAVGGIERLLDALVQHVASHRVPATGVAPGPLLEVVEDDGGDVR